MKKPESSINNDGYSTENSRATTIESNVRMSYSQCSDEERPSDISSYSEKESEHDSNDVKSDENETNKTKLMMKVSIVFHQLHFQV